MRLLCRKHACSHVMLTRCACPFVLWRCSKIGHFTQLVWVSSTRLGCGVAVGNGGRCKVRDRVCHGPQTCLSVSILSYKPSLQPGAVGKGLP